MEYLRGLELNWGWFLAFSREIKGWDTEDGWEFKMNVVLMSSVDHVATDM